MLNWRSIVTQLSTVFPPICLYCKNLSNKTPIGSKRMDLIMGWSRELKNTAKTRKPVCDNNVVLINVVMYCNKYPQEGIISATPTELMGQPYPG